MTMPASEHHRIHRANWLRAAVLGANDGILSTASLMLGVAAAHSDKTHIMISGVAGLVAGAMSMAAGEYVSVHSQADMEQADLKQEKRELRANEPGERKELANIYVQRGLEPQLAEEVARQLMAHNALEAHARDELGISEPMRARPLQAALASGASFSAGAALPIVVTLASPFSIVMAAVSVTSLLFLAVAGAMGARAGGAPVAKGAWRVTLWGAIAMAVTAAVGMLFHTKV